jgi:hypothetical protein
MAARDMARASPDLKATQPFVESVNQRTGRLVQVAVCLAPTAEELHREWHEEPMAALRRLVVPAILMAMQQHAA